MLKISDVRQAIARLDEDKRGGSIIPTPGGTQLNFRDAANAIRGLEERDRADTHNVSTSRAGIEQKRIDAADVCRVLEISNAPQAVGRIDAEDRSTITIADSGNLNASRTIINESGLYALILTSRKPEARAFKRWVAAEPRRVLGIANSRDATSSLDDERAAVVNDDTSLAVSTTRRRGGNRIETLGGPQMPTVAVSVLHPGERAKLLLGRRRRLPRAEHHQRRQRLRPPDAARAEYHPSGGWKSGQARSLRLWLEDVT